MKKMILLTLTCIAPLYSMHNQPSIHNPPSHELKMQLIKFNCIIKDQSLTKYHLEEKRKAAQELQNKVRDITDNKDFDILTQTKEEQEKKEALQKVYQHELRNCKELFLEAAQVAENDEEAILHLLMAIREDEVLDAKIKEMNAMLPFLRIANNASGCCIIQ